MGVDLRQVLVRILDPETNQERVKKIPIRLGLKTQMNELRARNVLREEITKRNGQVPERRVLKRQLRHLRVVCPQPLLSATAGRLATRTMTKMDQIEIDLIGKFGEYPLDALDKFVLQTHLNAFAERYVRTGSKQARSYLMLIKRGEESSLSPICHKMPQTFLWHRLL
jgi:hypothetical protein